MEPEGRRLRLFLGQITSRLVEQLLDAVDARRGMRVLDVWLGSRLCSRPRGRAGCIGRWRGHRRGDGDAGRSAPSEDRLPRRQRRGAPVPDHSFDAVVREFRDASPRSARGGSRRVLRVLAPGGRLALTVWDVTERDPPFWCVSRCRVRGGGRAAGRDPVGPPFFRFSDEQEFARLLRDQGLEGVQVETITFSQTVSSSDELWRGLLAGTVRTSALIQGQTDEMQRQVHAAFDRVIQPYRVGNGLELPVSVKLASARADRNTDKRWDSTYRWGLRLGQPHRER